MPEELQRMRASQGWRQSRVEVFHGTSEGSVVAKGQRPPRRRARYHLLNGFAHLTGLPLLKAAPAYGGARAQQIEVDRLRRLAAAGVAVPVQLLAMAPYLVTIVALVLISARKRGSAAPGSLGQIFHTTS